MLYDNVIRQAMSQFLKEIENDHLIEIKVQAKIYTGWDTHTQNVNKKNWTQHTDNEQLHATTK